MNDPTKTGGEARRDPGSEQDSEQGGGHRKGLPPVRVALWTVLVLTVVAVAAATLWSTLHREPAEPLPDLGQVPAFSLTGRDGRTVTLADLAGKPFVIDFIFTRCVSSCPLMTAAMTKVGDGLVEGEDFRRVSVSVDPEYDTPAVLTAYAKTHGAPSTWWFLTGSTKAIVTLMGEGFHLAVDPSTGDPRNPIAHSTRMVLVDGRGRIRGYYQGLDQDDLAHLNRDLRRVARGG